VINLGDHLRLLADETRLRILHLLEVEPLTVAELQEILDLGQSSISGHLAKLKHAGLIIDVAEGSARRYRLREDLDELLRGSWLAVRGLSQNDPQRATDRARLNDVQSNRGASWIDRVAGCLHRAYAPGRTWESLCHGLVQFTRFGRCADIGAGDGSLLDLIAPHADTLVCVDPSPAMVNAGNDKIVALGLTHVRYQMARAEELPLADNSCDSVLFLQSLQFIDDPAKALAEAFRVLAPEGRLLVLTLASHDYDEASAFGHAHRGFSHDQLRRWCKDLGQARAYDLAPESKAPRFQTVVFTASKIENKAKSKRKISS